MDEKVTIKIKDKEYVIRGSDNRDRIIKVAAYVDNKIKEISEIKTGLPDDKIAVLTALDIAGDYFQLLEEKKGLLEEVKRRSQRLMQRLSTVLN
ncbi:MAG: cell division protein ZapA [Deltaproteobacteria bacterium]|jgi:cell division protein ZapA|nr:cell division protein ZapA [Deltaproteobacteria bacterium]